MPYHVLKGLFVRGDEIQAVFADGYGFRSPDFGVTWYDLDGEPASASDIGFDANNEQNSVIGASGQLYRCDSETAGVLHYAAGATVSGVVNQIAVDIASNIALIGTSAKLYKSSSWGTSVLELLSESVTDLAIGGNYLTEYEMPEISGMTYEIFPESDYNVAGMKKYPNPAGSDWQSEANLPEVWSETYFSPVMMEGDDYIVYVTGYGVNKLYKYNITTNVWTYLCVPPAQLWKSATISPDGTKLVWMGLNASVLYIYTISNGNWVVTSAAPNMTVHGSHPANIQQTVWFDDNIIWVHVRDGGGDGTNQCFRYSISGDSWVKFTNYYAKGPYNSSKNMAVNTAGTVLYVGCVHSAGAADLNIGFKYTIATDTYTLINHTTDAFTSSAINKLWIYYSSRQISYYDCDTEAIVGTIFPTDPLANVSTQSVRGGFYGTLYVICVSKTVEPKTRSFMNPINLWINVHDKDSTWQGGAQPWDGEYIYNDGTTTPLKGLFGLDDIASGISIAEVRLISWVGEETTGTAYNIIRTHSTEYNGATRTLTSHMEQIAVSCAVNPNTGIAWTVSEVNDLIAGVWLQTSSGDTMCDQVYVQVIDDSGSNIYTVGNVPIERTVNIACTSTLISRARPMTKDGTIRWVDVFFPTVVSGLQVAIFYKTGGSDPPGNGTYSTRSAYTIGTVESGFRRLNVLLSVEVGDFIGLYATAGFISADYGFVTTEQLISAAGDNIPCTDVSFTPVNSTYKYVPSIRGVMIA